MTGCVSDPHEDDEGNLNGYEVAERLGLEAIAHMVGDSGGAYALDDGRWLKVTGSKVDAAVALAIADVGRPPGVPRFDEVHSFPVMVGIPGHPSLPLTKYALVREDMDDLDCQGDEAWRAALQCLNVAWHDDDPAMMARAEELWPGPELVRLIENLTWYRDVVGVKLLDVRVPNVGMTADGGIGMRDLGMGIVPDHLLAALAEVPELPDAPAPRPA